MQASVNDVTVNETPPFLNTKSYGETHEIVVTEPNNFAAVILPIALNSGVASCLPAVKVSMEDWNQIFMHDSN